MANVKIRLEKIQKNIDSLMELNQDSYIRNGKNLKPTNVDWDLEKHGKMFQSLYDTRKELEWALQDLKHIY